MLELGVEARRSLGFRTELERAAPFETGFGLTPGAPVGVAEMIDDLGVGRRELSRLFQLLDGVVILAELEIGPAEAVDDIALVGPRSDCFADQVETFLDLLSAVDPAIAEEILQLRPVGLDGEGGEEISLSLRPIAGIAASGRASE